MAVSPASLPKGYYNAALDLLDRNLAEGRDDKLAVIDDKGVRQAIAQPRVAGVIEGLHIWFGQNGVKQAFGNGGVAGGIKAEMVPKRVAGGNVDTKCERQATDWQPIYLIDNP